MARLIAVRDKAVVAVRDKAVVAVRDRAAVSLAECVDALESWGFDPGDEVNLAHAASWLVRLGNNTGFLGDLLIGALGPGGQAGAPSPFLRMGANASVLVAPGKGNFYLIARIWPSPADSAYQTSGPAAFDYGVLHDHNFDFLELGYFGPGPRVDDFEYDPASVVGYPGESVALRRRGRFCMEPGTLVHYRAGRDIHCVHPPASLSITLSLAHCQAVQGWRDHYVFSLEAAQADHARIVQRLGAGPSEAFIRIAVALGSEEALDLAERFARHHPSDRMRLCAWQALADAASDAAARDRLWRQ
ncbi:transposase, partial [Novosphingobium sp. 1949]